MNNNTPAIDAEADLKSFDSSGFTLKWSTNDAVASQFGYLTFAANPTGILDFTYDSAGDLVKVVDLKGGVTTYTYSNHYLTSLTDSNNHVAVQNIYDSAGRVVEQTDAVSGKTCVYYGAGPTYSSAACTGVSPAAAAGQTIVVDPRGKKTTYDFDTKLRTTSVTDHDGNVTSFTYDSSNNRTCAVDPLIHRTGYTYGSNGNVTGVIDAENTDANCALKSGGVKWTYTYTSLNDVDLETDPLGRTTDYVYDSNGNLTEVIRKDASSNTKLYTCFTRPTSGTDKGLVTELIESTNLTSCTGNKTKFTYDSYGNQTEVIDPRFSSQATPPKTIMTYDLLGRRLTVDNELSHTTTFTYDAQNNVLSVEDELGNKTVNTYDAKGNLKTVTDANRETVSTAESGASCGTAGTGDGDDDDSDTVIDDGCPSTIYNYDDADRLTSVIDALGNTTSYGYDANGNRTSVTNANRQTVGTAESGSNCGTAGTGNGVDNDSDGAIDDGCPSVIYTYSNRNLLASQTDALGNVWSYVYDAAGRLDTRTDAKSQVTDYGYNLRNDLTSIDYPAGTTDVSFTYDAVRNRTQMADGTGTTTYTPDALNRLSSVTFPGSRTVSYGFDNAGRRTSITYPGGSNQVTYGYDEANNLTSVTDWNSNQTTYTHNNAGMLTGVTLPSGTGVTGTYGYDNADRLTSVTWAKSGVGTLASATYAFDAVGNRKTRVDQAGTHTYTYDASHKLTGADYPGTDNDSYSYDKVGNRLTKTGVTGGYAYDAADRMTSAGGVSYGYDNNGNQTSRGASDTFSWDAEDRLTSATVSSTTSTFAYNGDGLRESTTTGGTTTTFTWDISSPTPQVLDDGTFKYIYGLGRIAEVGPSTTTHYYLPDGLGSTMALTNSVGTVVNTYDYDVFGAVRASTGTQANAFQFTGEQVDAGPGFQYLRSRYYQMDSGRFISRDRIAATYPNNHPYGYGGNNPTRFVDPWGTIPEDSSEAECLLYNDDPFFCGDVSTPPCDPACEIDPLKFAGKQITKICKIPGVGKIICVAGISAAVDFLSGVKPVEAPGCPSGACPIWQPFTPPNVGDGGLLNPQPGINPDPWGPAMPNRRNRKE